MTGKISKLELFIGGEYLVWVGGNLFGGGGDSQ
jgi:hypothetical protein